MGTSGRFVVAVVVGLVLGLVLGLVRQVQGTILGDNTLATSSQYMWIADDDDAEHVDLFDTNNPTSTGFTNNVYQSAATDTAGGEWTDVSVTDAVVNAQDVVFVLHTDGKLYQVDAVTADHTLVKVFDPTNTAGRDTFDSITNLPGSTNLFMLRTDRPTEAKQGGTQVECIDVYDFATDKYTQDVYTTVGTGGIAISDGPDYSVIDGTFSSAPAIYLIARQGFLEVFDPNEQAKRKHLHAGTPDGEYVNITNIEGDNDHLYLLRDRPGEDGNVYPDKIDVYEISTDIRFDDVWTLEGMSGAVGISDTSDGDLFVVATRGANTLITDIRYDDPVESGALIAQNSGVHSHYVDTTNIILPEPSTLVLLCMGAVGLLLCAWCRKRV